jgi:hypothetical protein
MNRIEATPELRANLFAVLDAFPDEASYVLEMLEAGRIDGSTFGPQWECACMFGSIARARGQSGEWARQQAKKYGKPHYFDLTDCNVNSQSEELFSYIHRGYTPANNPHAALAAELIVEWMKARGVKP